MLAKSMHITYTLKFKFARVNLNIIVAAISQGNLICDTQSIKNFHGYQLFTVRFAVGCVTCLTNSLSFYKLLLTRESRFYLITTLRQNALFNVLLFNLAIQISSI